MRVLLTDNLGSSNDDGDSDESSGESQEVEGDYKTFSNWNLLMPIYRGYQIIPTLFDQFGASYTIYLYEKVDF